MEDGAGTGSKLGWGAGSSVGLGAGIEVGAGTGSAEGAGTGSAEGAGAGSEVGAEMGSAEGAGAGSAEGAGAGSEVGAGMGSNVGEELYTYTFTAPSVTPLVPTTGPLPPQPPKLKKPIDDLTVPEQCPRPKLHTVYVQHVSTTQLPASASDSLSAYGVQGLRAVVDAYEIPSMLKYVVG